MNNISTWDYRVYCDRDGDYGFIETYYDQEGNIISYSDFINPIGSNIKELELDLENMARALNKPPLFYADMPEYKGEKNEEIN